MAKQIYHGANLDMTDTFAGMVNRVNDLIHDSATIQVTTTVAAVPNAQNGGLTVGNAHIQGTLSANVLTTPRLTGGTIENPANLTVGSNAIFQNTALFQNVVTVNSNTNLNGANVTITANTNIRGTKAIVSANTDIVAANLVVTTTNTAIKSTGLTGNVTNLRLTGALAEITYPEFKVTAGNTSIVANTAGLNISQTQAIDVNTAVLSINSATLTSNTTGVATFNAPTLNVNATTLNITGTTTNINGTSVQVNGTTSIIATAPTVNVTSTTVNVNANNVNMTSNAYVIGGGNVQVNSTVNVSNTTTLSGNTTVSGNLTVTAARTAISSNTAVTGNVTMSGTYVNVNTTTLDLDATTTELNSNTLTMGANTVNMTVKNTNVTGNVAVTGSVVITGPETINGALFANGNVTLGDAVADLIDPKGSFSTDLIPLPTVSLGSSNSNFLNVFARTVNAGNVIATRVQASNVIGNLQWSNVISKPSPVIGIKMIGGVEAEGTVTLSQLGSANVVLTVNVIQQTVELGNGTSGDFIAGLRGEDGVIVLNTANSTSAAQLAIRHADTSEAANTALVSTSGIGISGIDFKYDKFGHVISSTLATTDYRLLFANTAFNTITAGGVNIVANNIGATLNFVAGAGIQIQGNASTRNVNIASTDTLDSIVGRGASTTRAATFGNVNGNVATFTQFVGDGSTITNTNAAALSSGLIPDARINTNIPRTTRAINTNNGLTGGGNLTADRNIGLTGQALAFHNLATNGLVVKSGTGTAVTRSLVGGDGVSVTNADGISGNPTIAVDSSVVRNTRNVNTGTGLTGGGSLAADRTLAFDQAWGDTKYMSYKDIGGSNLTYNDMLVSGGTNGAVAFYHSGGSAPTDAPVANTQSSGLRISHTWGETTLVIPNNTNDLYVRGKNVATSSAFARVWTNENITPVPTARTVTAGNGLSGGGSLAGNISFAVGAGNGISVNATAVSVDATVARLNGANIFEGNQTITGGIVVQSVAPTSGTEIWLRSTAGVNRGTIHSPSDSGDLRLRAYIAGGATYKEAVLDGDTGRLIAPSFSGNGSALTSLTATALTGTVATGNLPSTIVYNSRAVNTGNGLAGGGALSADRTLYINAGNGLVSNTTGIHVQTGSGITQNTTHIYVVAGSGITATSTGVAVDDTVMRNNSSQTISGGEFAVRNTTATIRGRAANNNTLYYLTKNETTHDLTIRSYAVGGATYKDFVFSGDDGNLIAARFQGSGAGLTSVPATSLSGVVPDANLPTDLVFNTRSIVAGNGISGGGTLAANRSIYIDAGSGLVSNSTGIHIRTGNGITANSTHVYVNAGNGLEAVSTGLLLGTPSSITHTSTNQVTTSSHTHAISEGTIRNLIADGVAGWAGTYAFLAFQTDGTTLVAGQNYAGSNLRYAGGYLDTEYTNITGSSQTPSGTWQAMGAVPGNSGRRPATLFMRVA